MNEGLQVLLVVLAVIGLIYGALSIVMWIRSASCASTGELMNVSHQWNYFTGCMIEVNEKWIPLSSYYMKEDLI